MRSMLAVVILALQAVLLQVVSPAVAQDVAEFYRGKTLTIVIGYPPASGYSFYGQILARSLGEHIPGNPNVVVQNMPGAGSIKSATYLYKVAPRDGSVIGIFSIGALIDELLGTTTAGLDTTKFAWIGNMDQSVGVCVVKGATGITRFADLLRRDTVFGGTGPSGGATQAALALTRLLGARIRLVKGYPGAEDAVVAIDRGEVEGVCGLTKAVLKSRLSAELQSGALRPIVHDAMVSQSDLPGVPSIYDLAKNPKDREVLDLLFGWRVLGRPIAAPPSLPAERLQALQSAFTQSMADPRLIGEIEKANLDLAPSSGTEVSALVARLFNYSRETIVRAAAVVRNN
jgi:tripartite-type tricarboxylate transporter receptor subunit TctC